MEEHVQKRYQSPPRKKRFRFGRFLIVILLLFVLVVIAFSIMQFQSGKKLASVTKQPEQSFQADAPTSSIENTLILGVDSRGEEQSRTDTMMLLSWNKDTNDFKMVSFMRDIYATIPGYQSYKLNTAYYLGGAQLLKDTLNGMFSLSIHHYAVIDFKSFEQLVDILAPNGIKVDVEKDMSEAIGVTLTQGTHELNGQELLGYARFRQDAEGDFGRVTRQQKVMEALKEQLITIQNAKNIPKFLGAVQGYVTTDLSTTDELKMALSMLRGGANIEKIMIPAEGTYSFSSYSHAGSVIEVDLEQNKAILREFLQ